MTLRRRVALAAVAALLVATTAAYLFVRATGGFDPEVHAEGGGSTTTTERATTTTTRPTTTTSASTTTTTTASPPPPTTAAPATTAAPPPPPTTAPQPPFHASVETVTLEELGASWRPDLPCPGPDQLRAVVVSHWGYDGLVHTGRLIVAASQAEAMVDVFHDLFTARFPIQQMVPISEFGGNDQASMRANNTSGFNCRYVAGTTTLSQHALGLAVDVNPLVNPYVTGGSVDPPEGAPYANRDQQVSGMIHAGDAVVAAFARQGWGWGGYWRSGKDYQHFSASGS